MSLPYHRGHTANTSSMHRNNSGNRANEVSTTLMELENNQRWEELGRQVEMLKELSMDINTEVKSQNSLLDNMGISFSSTSELFNSTIGKLGNMLNAPGSKHMYYLIGFVVFVFILLYYMMGRK